MNAAAERRVDATEDHLPVLCSTLFVSDSLRLIGKERTRLPESTSATPSPCGLVDWQRKTCHMTQSIIRLEHRG